MGAVSVTTSSHPRPDEYLLTAGVSERSVVSIRTNLLSGSDASLTNTAPYSTARVGAEYILIDSGIQ
jgi:hypothetical protein